MSNGTTTGSEQQLPEDASYEDLVKRLEESVVRLESGELSLEQALLEYEFGMRVIERCNDMLDKAEIRVTELSSRVPHTDNDDELA